MWEGNVVFRKGRKREDWLADSGELHLYDQYVFPSGCVLWRQVFAVGVVGDGTLRNKFDTLVSYSAVYVVHGLHKCLVLCTVNGVEKCSLYGIGGRNAAEAHTAFLVAVSLAVYAL